MTYFLVLLKLQLLLKPDNDRYSGVLDFAFSVSVSLNLHYSVRLLCGLSLEEEPINTYLDPREASDSESDEIVKCVVDIRRMYEIVLMEYEVGLPLPPKDWSY